jgi:hypothetical protein
MTQTFTAAFSDSLGAAADLKLARVRFGTTNVAACVVDYNAMTAVVRLLDDSGAAGPWTALGRGTLANSQCSLDLTQTSAIANGTSLTLTLRLAFTPSFVGQKSVYLRANSHFGTATDFVLRGTWTVAAVVQAISISPGSGAGPAQSFTLAYADSAGAADLTAAMVRFVPADGGAGRCVVAYNAAIGRVRIQDDGGAWGAWTMLGSGTLANSYCALNLAQSTAQPSGTDLSVVVHLTFAPGFTGTKDVQLRANSQTGVTTGWQMRGSWTVP